MVYGTECWKVHDWSKETQISAYNSLRQQPEKEDDSSLQQERGRNYIYSTM